jgi:hypothetical protein
MAKKSGKKNKPVREQTKQFFDKMLKFMLKEVSRPALVRFINNLFSENHAPESEVKFMATENATKTPEGEVKRTTSDMILTIGGEAYHIEAQISDDNTIAMRVFQYGFAYALQNRITTKGGERITLKMPTARVLYFESTPRTPDTATLCLEFPDGRCFEYAVKTFKVLEHDIEELDRRDMALLFPFYLLKDRQEAWKSGVTPERLAELAADTGRIEAEIVRLVAQEETEGRLCPSDVALIYERLLVTHEKLYGEYPQFQEEYMKIDEMLKAPIAERMRALEQEIAQTERQTKDQVRALLQQGYTTEQLMRWLDADAPTESSARNTVRA